ncbi:MAG TPA: ATP-binding protein [Anaeromyxobacteraceae bacterium]|nr:ATP-binding protein [Anaeromyxobacteraceae bacterium]
MSLRGRLLLAQAPLAAALVLVGAASLRTVTWLGESSENILKDNYRSVLAAQRMNTALDVLDADALGRAMGRVMPALDAPARQRFESELRVQEGNITEPGEAEATKALRTAWESYQQALAAAAQAREPVAAYLDSVHRASMAVRQGTDEVLSINQDAMVRKSNLARRTSQRLLYLMLAATGAALALGLVASFTLTARMVRPLSALTQAVRRFGEGDVEARVRPKGVDEIALLGREFDTMADRLEEYRKSSLGDLLQAQQASQAAIDSLPDPVLILDTEGVLLNLNQAAEALLRLSPGNGAGKPVHSLEPALRERLEAVQAHVLGGKGAVVPRGFEEAVRVELPDGPRRLLPRATALYSAEGTVSGVTIVLQDVTRLVRFDELKNDLVATVAHEFRTPLTSLRMAIHLLAEEAAGPLVERQADLVQAARQDCERLQAIVDDILDLSRIQAGRIELHAKPIDARWLLAQAAAGVESSARAADVKLAVEAPDDALPVLADAERVDVVLTNMLGNAVRHTPAGGRIVARARATGPAVRFEVEDTGAGIPRQYQDRIFERFFQVPGGKRGGVGLGLYISREIVRAHGGEMGVVSEEGRGSTFWFTLPSAGDAPAARR